MRERPILFKGPMVRAILAGNKTQTRRIVKDPNGLYAQLGQKTVHPAVSEIVSCGDGMFRQTAPEHIKQMYISTFPCHSLRTPYGQPGDRLWVRETVRPIYPQDPAYNGGQPIEYDYAATYRHGSRLGDTLGVRRKWTPSIHMPRRACRLVLEVAGVRVERLNAISEADAMAEGIVRQPDDGFGLADSTHYHATDPRVSFLGLWEAINGDGSVAANPWVWVIEFRVLASANNETGGGNGHAA
ncbi:hypothetical protein [Achromobacter sp. CSND-B12]|uniref:hypothetical protein n=1 Tax=Achromobacter sp. CSND-B12 TaxID=3462570 RepID=UPI00406A39A4